MIYEVGAGNGTLMRNIMDYVHTNSPEVYKDMTYSIIEISTALSRKQTLSAGKHVTRLRFINQSIFDWNTRIDDKAYLIALEVIV